MPDYTWVATTAGRSYSFTVKFPAVGDVIELASGKRYLVKSIASNKVLLQRIGDPKIEAELSHRDFQFLYFKTVEHAEPVEQWEEDSND